MSSSPKPPYKSRLFNLINRQYLQIKDKLGQTLRQAKQTVEWGLQIIIYPVYLLTQTGRLLEGQIKQRWNQVNLLLSADASTKQIPQEDRPIKTVLKTVEKNHLKVQGIATNLQNQHLVLVTQENEILDILSTEQQRQLQNRLSWELVKYWRNYRVLQASKKSLLSLPVIKSDNPNLIFPVRWFWQVMGWMQTGDLAIAINLFDEANIIVYPQTNQPSLLLSDFWHNLDNKIALWETNPLVIVENLTTSITHSFRGTVTKKESDLEHTESEQVWQIQALIRAAIDYFFNHPQTNFEYSPNSPSQLSSNQQLALPGGTQPWVSWTDLFEELPINTNSTTNNEQILSSTTTIITGANGKETVNLQSLPSYVPPSDWVETSVTPLGYVKHPLVKVLEWLDHLIVWVEDKLVALINWVVRRFR